MAEPAGIDVARVAAELGLTLQQVENVTSLLDAGNTVPFITRYRKEQTGNLDEEQIRAIEARVGSLRQLAERAQTILRLIETQGKLTPELRAAILEADSLKRLEDLYLPYRPKRRSRAMQARERGLGPLAERIWNQDPSLADIAAEAAALVDPEKELPSPAEVIQGVTDILAEQISEDPQVRERARKTAWQTGRLTVAATKAAQEKEAGQEYRDYFDYSEMVSQIPPHRVLALNRGEKAGALRVKFEWDEGRIRAQVAMLLRLTQHRFSTFVEACAGDALARFIQPSLEREVRRELTDRAEAHAVSVFAKNLRSLLLQPPLRGERVVAIDPGFRTGCKLAALDEFGNCLATDVAYVTGNAEKKAAARQKLAQFAATHGAKLFAIGNGTACRETEELISETIAEHFPEARYVIVNEAGASIYSASTVAREEFPDFDATIRGTISIGRRLQDPLSELVKIEPQHIGVGMYQHDVSARLLNESLNQVIESCVNYVGVDLNTASASLLRHVSGLNQLIARRVVAWRDEHGRFTSRRQLLSVPGVGEATFTQAAGFLKIAGGEEPLDSTWIHPESYAAARKVLDRLATPTDALPMTGGTGSASVGLQAALAEPVAPGSLLSDSSRLKGRLSELDPAAIAGELNVGLPTLLDILDALSRPGRDPRVDLAGPVFKRGVLKLDDLHDGMELTGTVLNVVDFGAFVDIGLKDSGLVHISQMSSRYVPTPHELVAVGDIVTVWVLGIDRERKRVSLTMIDPASPQQPARQRQAAKASPVAQAPPGAKKVAGQPPLQVPSPPPADQGALRGFDELKLLWQGRET